MFSRESLKLQVKTVVTVILAVGVVVLFLAYRSALPSDLLFTFSIGSQVLLVVMGVLIALHEDWAKRHRWIVIGAFAAVGFGGFYTAVRDNRELTRERIQSELKADAASAKLSDSLQTLGTQNGEISRQTGEIKRMEGLNTGLQNRLLDQSGQLVDSSKRITDLSKEAIDTSTGGKSFCLMVLSAQFNPRAMTPVFEPRGKEPLYEVHARISDSQKFAEALKRKGGGPMTMEFIRSTEINLDLGNLSSTSALIRFDTSIEIDVNAPRQDFVIWFNARNGYWFEDLQLRRVGNEWAQAIRVFRMVGNKEQLILTQVPRNFPGDPGWRK